MSAFWHCNGTAWHCNGDVSAGGDERRRGLCHRSQRDLSVTDTNGPSSHVSASEGVHPSIRPCRQLAAGVFLTWASWKKGMPAEKRIGQ